MPDVPAGDHATSVMDQAHLSRPRGGVMEFLKWASRGLAAGMLPGLIAGLVVGGLGSRVAMRVMALTSEPAARGLETDFGATVGQITLGGTLFLLIAGSVLGMLGGIAYLAIRRLLPGRGWVRGLVFGTLLLALVGRLLVSPDNPDFVILSPAGLAVPCSQRSRSCTASSSSSFTVASSRRSRESAVPPWSSSPCSWDCYRWCCSVG